MAFEADWAVSARWQVASLLDDDAAQGPGRVRCGQPARRQCAQRPGARPGVPAPEEVLDRRVEPAHNPAGDLDAPLRPDRFQALEVRLHVGVQQRLPGAVVKPAMVALRSWLDNSVPWTAAFHAAALTSASGRAASAVAWPARPEAVVSRASSASSSARGLAVGGQGMPETPAQLGVHGESLHHVAPSRRPRSRGRRLRRVRLTGSHRPGPGQLLVRARVRRAPVGRPPPSGSPVPHGVRVRLRGCSVRRRSRRFRGCSAARRFPVSDGPKA